MALEAQSLARAHEVLTTSPLCTDLLPLPVVMVPANSRPLVPLAEVTREAFRTHLHAVLRTAFTSDLRDNTLAMTVQEAGARADAGEIDSPDAGSEPAMVAGTCGTCRGACCTDGGTHAFLKPDSLVRVRAQGVTLAGETADTPAAIAALYEAALPERHYRNSCVFHAHAGCTLPRRLRSNLCNRYQCDGLTQLARALHDSDAEAVYVGAASERRLRRLALVTSDRVEPIGVRTPACA